MDDQVGPSSQLPDPALVALAEMVQTKGISLYMGLQLRGQTMWGESITFETWLRNSSMSILGDPSTEGSAAIADRVGEAILEPGKDDAQLLHSGFLHLKTEEFRSPLDDGPTQYEYWRVRIADVSGWSLSK